jgi:hypothetical protein
MHIKPAGPGAVRRTGGPGYGFTARDGRCSRLSAKPHESEIQGRERPGSQTGFDKFSPIDTHGTFSLGSGDCFLYKGLNPLHTTTHI